MYHDTILEQKMTRIQQLREEQAQNHARISKRAEIMHPESNSPYSATDYNDFALQQKSAQPQANKFTGFKLRLFFSILLFIGFLYADIKDSQIYGITSSSVTQKVTEAFDINTIDFMKLFPYTLEENNG